MRDSSPELIGDNGSAAAVRRLSLHLVTADESHEALLDLAEAGHRESRFGYIPFSRDKARRILVQALAEERRHLLVVAEVRGRPQGFVFASAGEYHVGTGVLIVTINSIYVAAGVRKSLLGGRASIGLFRAVGKWTSGIGAAELMLHITSGIAAEKVERTVRRLGFNAIGGSFVSTVGSAA